MLTGFDSSAKGAFPRRAFLMAIPSRVHPARGIKATYRRHSAGTARSRKAPGQERIYTAGEKEYEMEKLVRQRGVAIVPNLQKEIRIMQAELGLSQYDFPF